MLRFPCSVSSVHLPDALTSHYGRLAESLFASLVLEPSAKKCLSPPIPAEKARISRQRLLLRIKA